jgi:hypothetical protein
MENKIDLFEYPELIPENVQSILNSFTECNYIELEKINNELKNIGYCFEYCLDAIPYNLRKLS